MLRESNESREGAGGRLASVVPVLRLTPFLFLIFITLWLRLVNLGYSDYQGDEIRAMWRPSAGQSALDYLFSQSKGPTEFLVSYLVKLIDPAYASEFLLRLPFALAGILSIYFFYRLVEMHFGLKIALYSSLLVSVNGIFVGLMRIAQYQPFVILFSVLTLYSFSLACQRERWRTTGIYAGMLFWAAAVLSHYDGIFIAPFVVYLLYTWHRKYPSNSIKTLAIAAVLSAAILAVYFIPFLLSTSSSITDYWLGRITGEEDASLLSSSVYTFKLYNPLPGFYLYAALSPLFLLKLKRSLPILLWFVLPWAFMELVIADPGTHIYTYLLPAAILAGLGLAAVEEIFARILGGRWAAGVNAAWLSLLFLALASISHLVFVDHTPEYPYEQRRILLWTVGGPDGTYRQWVFGFPYYRRWEAIRDFIASSGGNGYYATNEKTSLSSYYIPLAYDVDKAGYYIYVRNPQSFRERDMRPKIRYWREHHSPLKVFEADGRVVAEIYEMPPGTLEEIKKLGY